MSIYIFREWCYFQGGGGTCASPELSPIKSTQGMKTILFHISQFFDHFSKSHNCSNLRLFICDDCGAQTKLDIALYSVRKFDSLLVYLES
jgi:hypothetical protein